MRPVTFEMDEYFHRLKIKGVINFTYKSPDLPVFPCFYFSLGWPRMKWNNE